VVQKPQNPRIALMAGVFSSKKARRNAGSAMWIAAVLCWLSVASLLPGQTAGNTPPLLTNVSQIRKLSSAELTAQRPVQLKALVTYYSPLWPILLVQDSTGGIYVELTDLPKIASGNLIQLDAVLGPQGYLVEGKFKVLADKAPWPAPHRPTFEEFDSGKYDSQYILLTGYLYSIGNRSGHFVLELQGPQNKRFRALIPDDSISLDQLEKWIDCRLELTGVAGIEVNGLGVNTGCQLWVAEPSHIKVLEKSPADPLVTTRRVVAEIHQFSLRNEPLRRLSVLGVVTRQNNSSQFFIQDSTGGIFVHARDTVVLTNGAPVEVAGFPVPGAFGFILEEAVVRPTTNISASVSEPRVVTARAAMSGRYNGMVTRVSGRVLNCISDANGAQLLLQQDNVVFSVVLDEPLSKLKQASYRQGNQLDVTGVCIVKIDQYRVPRSFELLVNSPQDIVILERMPWLTTQIVLKVLGAVLLLSGLVSVWSIILRRQVRQQTRLLCEQMARESILEEGYRSLYENVTDLVYTHDLDGRIKSINKAAQRITGYTEAEARNINIFDVIAPEDLARTQDIMKRELAGETLPAFEVDMIDKSGRRLHLEVNELLIRKDGKTTGILGVARDVTERRNAREALERSEKALRAIIDAAPFGAYQFELGNNGAFLFKGANRAADRIQGRDHEPLIGKSLGEAFPHLAITSAADALRGTLNSGKLFETEVFDYQNGVIAGSHEYVGVRISERQVALFFRDITERKKAEIAVRESERMLRVIIDNIPQAVLWKDRNSVIVGCNVRQAQAAGFSNPKELAGKTDYDLFTTKQEAEAALANDRRVMASGTPQFHSITAVRNRQGQLMWQDTARIPLLDAMGNITGVLVTWEDITARKRAEEALRSSETKYRAVFDTSNDALIIQKGIEGLDVLDINQRFTKLYGYALDEARELGFEALIASLPPYTQEKARDYIRKAMQEGPQNFEWLCKDKVQRHFWAEISLQRCEFNDQVLVIAAVRDISNRKQLEEQLRQAQKMEAVGQLAGGVAHDFNNILTVIKGHASLLLAEKNSNTDVMDALGEINAAADRASNLTRQLLAFSRRQLLQVRQLDINEAIMNLARMLNRLLGEQIAIEFNYGACLPAIKADAGMIDQVIINLAVNARDAMPKGGRLLLKTELVIVDGMQAQRHPDAYPGRFISVSVSDEGCGMDQATLHRLFEPFFTTKELGKGTGLGLATIYGIVKQHQGWIEVFSEVNKGTTFKVYLPALEESAARTVKSVPTVAPSGGYETVLVVEDEAAVRLLATRCLKQAGYKILEAGDGVQALDVWSAHKDRIELLLTDMVMPEGMTGRELARQCQADKPSLKVLYSSGYSVEARSGEFRLADGVNFLPKPYAPSRLLKVVRDCLDQPVDKA
jgi:PAS domain S-box-containing protein